MEPYMREICVFVIPVNILTVWRVGFLSWAVCLDILQHMRYCLTDFPLILLYRGHQSSVRLPSVLRLPSYTTHTLYACIA